jgi:competence protein ComEC
MPLLWLSAAFLLGIVLANCTGIDWAWTVWTGIALAFCAGAFFESRLFARLAWLKQWRTHTRIPLLALGTALCLGAMRMVLAQPVFDAGDVAFYNDGGRVTLSAQVIAPPEPTDSGQYLLLEARTLTLQDDGSSRRVHGRVYAFIPTRKSYRYGDVLELYGQPVTPPSASQGFSYREYLARSNVYTSLPYASARRIRHESANPLLAGVYALRERAYKTINAQFPQPEAGLLSGILLGIDRDIPDDLYAAFRDTGTAHIIAISGFNIAVLVGVFTFLFRRFVPRLWLPVWVIAALALYAVLAGASASVVRAAIMGSVGVIGQTLGRRQTGANTLALTAALMALHQPLVLWDVGFQLSFAATFGLVLYGTRLEEALTLWLENRLPSQTARRVSGPIAEYILLTLAAQVTTLPVILYHFQRFSISAVAANPLALPPQPLVMIAGGLATLAGMVLPALGRVLSGFAWPLLAYTIRVVEWLATWKAGAISTGAFRLSWVWLYYAVLAAITLHWTRPDLFKKPANLPSFSSVRTWTLGAAVSFPGLVLTAALGLYVWRCALTAPMGRLMVYVLDEGKNAALLVRPPTGSAVLITSAESPALAQAVARRLPPLQHRLDLLVVPAAPGGGFDILLERLPPRWTIWNPTGLDSARLKTAAAALDDLNTGLQEMQPEDEFDLGGGAVLRVTAREPGAAALELEWKNFRLLAPGGMALAALETTPTRPLDGPTVIVLGSADAAALSDRHWPDESPLPLIVSAGASPTSENWIDLTRTGWVALVSDGEQLWVEQGKR